MTERMASAVPAQHFFDLDIRIGRVVDCERFPEARRPAYRMVIDFGELGQRSTSARLTDNYTPLSWWARWWSLSSTSRRGRSDLCAVRCLCSAPTNTAPTP